MVTLSFYRSTQVLGPPSSYLWSHSEVRKEGAPGGCWRPLPLVSPLDTFNMAPAGHCSSPQKPLPPPQAFAEHLGGIKEAKVTEDRRPGVRQPHLHRPQAAHLWQVVAEPGPSLQALLGTEQRRCGGPS